MIARDAETTSSSVQVETLLPLHDLTTLGAYRQKIVDRVFADMLNARYAEVSDRADPPFLAAAADREFFLTRTRDAASMRAIVAGDSVDRALGAMLDETERVARFGFAQTELDRATQNRLRAYERLRVESVNRESTSRADECIKTFSSRRRCRPLKMNTRCSSAAIGQIKLSEVNGLAKDWFPNRNRFVIIDGAR